MKGKRYKPWELVTLYITNLRVVDFARLTEYGVSYSGSTCGPSTQKIYGKFNGYVASYLFELNRAVYALKWKTYKLEKLRLGGWRLRRI